PAGATAAAITAAEEDHIRGHDLGGVVLLPFLVGPLARLQASFDVALAPLGQVLTAELAELPPHHDAVPLGALLLLPLLVGPRLAGGDAEVGDRLPARGEADLRIRAEVAHQDDLVHSCHDCAPSRGPAPWTGPVTCVRRMSPPRGHLPSGAGRSSRRL